MTFQIDELRFKNHTTEELLRLRNIFDVLKVKAIKQKYLTEHEKEFFCAGVKFSRLNDGVLESYPCCENFKFKQIYLTYFYDLTGGSEYYKIKKTDIFKVDREETKADLQFLYYESEKWELTVQKTNHTMMMLQQICAETRNELKLLENLPEVINGYWRKGSFLYIFKERAVLLQSKFIYCIALEIFETFKPEDLVFEINGEQIEFTEYSLIHILNRHYAEIAKQYKSGKSFHNEDFKPRILSVQLKEILRDIANSTLLEGKGIDKIGFRYKGTDYLIWTNQRVKSLKGRGNIIYRRLETFYPVSDEAEKSKLILTCDLKKIGDGFYVYVPK